MDGGGGLYDLPTYPEENVPATPSRAPTNPKAAGKHAGRFQVLNRFVDVHMRDLTRPELVVWFALFRDTKDGTARTGQADLARRAGVSRRTVVRAVSALRKKGYLRVVRQGGPGTGITEYVVTTPKAGPEQ